MDPSKHRLTALKVPPKAQAAHLHEAAGGIFYDVGDTNTREGVLKSGYKLCAGDGEDNELVEKGQCLH